MKKKDLLALLANLNLDDELLVVVEGFDSTTGRNAIFNVSDVAVVESEIGEVLFIYGTDKSEGFKS